MKILIYSILIINCSFGEGNAQWDSIYSDSSYNSFYELQFFNINTGYIVGGGFSQPLILKTTNGGINWINRTPSPSTISSYYDLSFINDNTGYACGYSIYMAKTTNGGLNWNFYLAPCLGNAGNYCILFLNEQTGYLGGRYGMNAKTTNGGMNWTLLDTSISRIYDMFFFDMNTGFRVNAYSTIEKTMDGGINWDNSFITDTNGNDYAFYKIDFVNYTTGFVVGARANPTKGAIFKTTNGGMNWKNVYIEENNELYGIDALNSTLIYAVGSLSKVLKSTDGGNTWSYQAIPSIYTTNNCSVRFLNENTGYLAKGLTIYKTTNGGNVFVGKISSEIPVKYSLSQNYPNPFNPMTKIRFEIAMDSRLRGNDKIVLKVFDILGKEIQTLVKEQLQPGSYEVTFDGSNFPSGVYFYQLRAGDYMETKKMLMIK
jgi:photosystem II stability/assembly factor-like uncharacterized protein